jgi:NarL family two-component system response regulator LiaR
MTAAIPLRLLVVDDQPVVRTGLATLLEAYEELDLVGAASGGEEAIRLCGELQPDVVLMDMMMPGMDGVTATRIIRERWPEIQVIVLTAFHETELIHNALQAGAVSYLLKNVSGKELVQAIWASHTGRSTLSPEVAHSLIQSTLTSPLVSGDNLTARETEILALMIQGRSNPKIAEQLGISVCTVRFHVSNILAKLKVTRRTKAVVEALQHSLVG